MCTLKAASLLATGFIAGAAFAFPIGWSTHAEIDTKIVHAVVYSTADRVALDRKFQQIVAEKK